MALELLRNNSPPVNGCLSRTLSCNISACNLVFVSANDNLFNMLFIKPQVLALGTFTHETLSVSTGPSSRHINPAIEAKVESLWQEKLTQTQASGQTCYNGYVYRLNSLTVDEHTLSLNFAEIEFRTFSCLESLPEYYDLSEEYFCKNCHTSATVKTTDNRYLMIELSGKSLNHNTVDLLGGVLETRPIISNGDDLFTSQYKEMKEEGCVQESDIAQSYLRMVYLGQRTSVGFYFEVILNISSAEIVQQFKIQHNDPDVNVLLHLSREEYLSHLQNHKNANKRLLANACML